MAPNGTIVPCSTVSYNSDDAKAAHTILSLPLGLSTGGLPVGANFAGPLGSDSTILSLCLALEKVLGRTPPAPSMPGCMGCIANVTNQMVRGSVCSSWLSSHWHGNHLTCLPACDICVPASGVTSSARPYSVLSCAWPFASVTARQVPACSRVDSHAWHIVFK